MHLKIHKPQGLEDNPTHWTIERSDGMFIASPCNLIDRARPEQAKIIQDMVDAYNDIHGDL